MKPSELLDSEEKWCKGSNAKDENGIAVIPESPRAIKWCLVGAVYKTRPFDTVWEDIEKLRAHLGLVISDYNDAPERTFAEVRAALLAVGL